MYEITSKEVKTQLEMDGMQIEHVHHYNGEHVVLITNADANYDLAGLVHSANKINQKIESNNDDN